jgi:Xaa-Pro aminopeptidase
MTFETLTLVPIDRRLILPELMSDAEIAWLDAYHRRVRDEIGPHLSPGDRQWLLAVTEPIRR